MTLPTLTIPAWPQAGEREGELLQSVLSHAQWGGFHPFIDEIEQRFSAYQGARHGIAACNGTVTLELMLQILGIGKGDEIIVPAISFISTATAVSRAGAVPVFVDIGDLSFNIDYDRIEEAITPRTKAVLLVHFAGIPCEMERLTSLCRKHNLMLIEDAAHAHGSEWNGQRLGSFGIASSFSFQNGKVLCCGEGGMLLTDDEDFAEKARSFVNCGRKAGESFYKHYRLGTNLRMTGLQAAVLLAQFERLPAQIAKRTSNAKLLKDLLSDVEEITWQHAPAAMTQCSWYLLVGQMKGSVDRNGFVRNLQEHGIPCTPFYPHTLFQNPLYQGVAKSHVQACPVAEQRVQDGFWFPHRLLLADTDTVETAASCIRSAIIANRRVPLLASGLRSDRLVGIG